LNVSEEGGKPTFRLSASASQGAIPDSDPWLRVLGGETYSRRHALFTNHVFVQGNKFQDDPMRRIFSPAHGMGVEIINAKGLAKTVIAVNGKNHSGSRHANNVETKISEQKEILIDLIEERTILGQPAFLPFRFRYHPANCSASIRDVKEAINDRFSDEKVPLDAAVTDVFGAGCTQVTGKAIPDFLHSIGNNGEAFVGRPLEGSLRTGAFRYCGWVGSYPRSDIPKRL